MIDLKQYEVWFVTGSQHLYGPKTLETGCRTFARDCRSAWRFETYAGEGGFQASADHA